MADVPVRRSGDAGLDKMGPGKLGAEALMVEKLAGEQRTALEFLVLGKSVVETAKHTGVSRGTIYHWLKHDAVFRAVFNQWQDEMQQSCRSRLMMMTDKAATALERSLEAGDARSALQLLKGMGLIGAKPTGSSDPAVVAKEAEVEETKRAAKLRWDEFEAEFGW